MVEVIVGNFGNRIVAPNRVTTTQHSLLSHIRLGSITDTTSRHRRG